MVLERINPPELHEPFDGLYAQIIKTQAKYTYRISGQVAIDTEKKNVGVGSMKEQLECVYDMVTRALKAVNLTWDNVVHIYTFTTDMEEYMKYEKPIALAAFGDRAPASTLVEVSKLVDPAWLVEVQVDAIGD